jgi:hypothetical protein
MDYPLTPGGPEDYPTQPGAMLLTLVEPHKGFERAFNRWYERDHFYAGCMEGANCFAGARWVATRELKDLRWPRETDVAEPFDAGSFVAIYWILAGRLPDWQAWAAPRLRDLYANGRGFSERTHVNTNMYAYLGADYRDADPTPVALALDRHYAGLVAMWFDGLAGRTPADSLAELRAGALPELFEGSEIEIAASFAPIIPPADQPRPQTPMKMGAGPGGPTRFCQLFFLDSDPRPALGRLRAYAQAVRDAGVAELRLAAPFIKTIVGTDTYLDQL